MAQGKATTAKKAEAKKAELEEQQAKAAERTGQEEVGGNGTKPIVLEVQCDASQALEQLVALQAQLDAVAESARVAKTEITLLQEKRFSDAAKAEL